MVMPRTPVQLSELNQAGGAYVRRAFDFGERKLTNGDTLTQEELESIPLANLQALVNTGKLQLWPKAPTEMYVAERFIVPAKSRGKFYVVEGRKLGKAITKKQAEALVAAG